MAYVRAGRREDARRLLSELEERKQRGEAIPPPVGTDLPPFSAR